MAKTVLFILLCVGIVSMVSGCYYYPAAYSPGYSAGYYSPVYPAYQAYPYRYHRHHHRY